MIDFNVNEIVLVKLTETGKVELERQHEELNKLLPKLTSRFKGVTEDEDGFSRWQLWSLMKTFGHMISMGQEPPFETNIKLDK